MDRNEEHRKDIEDQEYRKSLEQLVNARTEQLREAYGKVEELVQALKQIQSLTSLELAKKAAQAAIQKFGPQEPQVLKFGGEPGEAVPEVDPEDVKTAWRIQKDAEARNPGKSAAIGADLLRRSCKPGANIEAIGYRTAVFFMVRQIAPEQWACISENGEPNDAAFAAAAKVRLEWMATGVVRQGPPFDPTEFFRLCGLA